MSARDDQKSRMCDGKIRLRTAVEAGELAEKLFQRTGVFVAIYQCWFCDGGWHIGGSGLRPVDQPVESGPQHVTI